MFKGMFWRIISRCIDYIMDKQKEIYFSIIVLGILVSIIYGIDFYHSISGNNLIEQPKSAAEFLLRPFLLTLLVVILMIMATIFFAMVLSFSALKKLKVFKVEMEFSDWQETQHKIVNNLRFTSSVLRMNNYTVKRLINDGRTDFPDIVRYLVKEFNELIALSDNHVEIEADVVTWKSLESYELDMYDEIKSMENNHTLYRNSYFNAYNVLLGVVKSPTEDNDTIVRFRKPVEYAIDDFDKETLESLLAHAINLQDAIIMVEELEGAGLE